VSSPDEPPSLADRSTPPLGPVRLVATGLVAAAIGIASTIVVAATTVAVLPEPLIGAGSLVAVAVVAGPIGLAVGMRSREHWVGPTILAGGLLGGFLYLRGRAFVMQGQPISYPLLFGLPGVALSVASTLGGGWVGSRATVVRRLAPSRLSPLTRTGLVVATGWTVIELLFGIGAAATIGPIVDNTFVVVLVATTVGFPFAAGVAVWYGRRAGIARDDLNYRTTRRTAIVGIAAGLATAVAVQATGFAVTSVTGTEAANAAFGFLLADLEAGVWVLVLFTFAHGFVAPLTEELAWRGIVQTALVEARGPAFGIAVTAILFTTKHAVLDASFARVPSVLVLSVALGLARHRWGTTASTIIHVIVNLAGVLGLAILVFG
jgi:hypothetical protein